MIIIFFVAISSLAWNQAPAASHSVSGPLASPTRTLELSRTPNPTQPPAILNSGEPTATPLPVELLTNSNQTIGITLAAALLVLIVVGGVISSLSDKKS